MRNLRSSFKKSFNNMLRCEMDYEEMIKISDNLSDAAVNYIENGEKSLNKWIEKEETNEIFAKLSIKPDDFASLLKASIFDFSELQSEIFNIAHEKYTDLKNNTIKNHGCFKYLNNKNEETTDVHTTATCLYALYKSSNHLKDFSFESNKSKIVEWIFDKMNPIEYGWNYNSHENRNSAIDLFVTSYILNILIRVDPTRNSFEYERIIEMLINSFGIHKVGSWVNPDDKDNVSDEIYITSYCLRAISTYVKYYDNRPFKQHIKIEKLQEIREKAASKILYLKKDGCWVDKKITASALLALRTSNFDKNDIDIKEGCDWLISEMRFLEGSWCWTAEKEGKKYKSAVDSALILSALMRGCDFKRFARTETVLLWLLEVVKNSDLDKNTAPILCSFTDYLRAIDEPSFLD